MANDKVVFIVPLKSKQVSHDWNFVNKLCANSINSILKQTSPHFHIIIVCNEPPNQLPDDSRITIVSEDFPIPGKNHDAYADQHLKIKRGMAAAKKLGSNYLMRMDADDFVHKDLVKFVLDNPCRGWYIPKGYVYNMNMPYVYVRNNFHYSCGTSHIIRVHENEMPDSLETPNDSYLDVFWQHAFLKKHFDATDDPLRPMPFRAALYLLGHSESLYSLAHWRNFRMFVWRILSIRPLPRSVIHNFNLIQE